MNSNANWTISTLDTDRVFYNLTQATCDEVTNYINSLPKTNNIDEASIRRTDLPMLMEEIIKFSNEVDNGQRFVVLKPIPGLNEIQIEAFHWILSKMLGETIVQNDEGRHLIHIYDRDPRRRIKDGARYHQTH